MNIQTIANNLHDKIVERESMLFMLKTRRVVDKAAIRCLEISINEHKDILQDVEQCVKQSSDDSWITNPDRMGGGGWSAEELDPNRGWK